MKNKILLVSNYQIICTLINTIKCIPYPIFNFIIYMYKLNILYYHNEYNTPPLKKKHVDIKIRILYCLTLQCGNEILSKWQLFGPMAWLFLAYHCNGSG